MTQKTILLTGATGFIGKALTQSLIQNGVNVVALVRTEAACRQLPEGCIGIIHSDPNQTLDQVAKYTPAGVIHLATQFMAAHTLDNISSMIDANVKFGTLLCDIVTTLNCPWMINTSTFWQHFNHEVYNPVNLYAASKQAFESIITYYQETSPTLFVHLELCDTFGPNDTRKKIIALLKQTALSGTPLHMSPGEQLMNLLYSDDVVSGFLSLVQQLETQSLSKKSSHFCLSASELLTLKDVVKTFETVYNVPVPIQFGALPYRPREVMNPTPFYPILPNWKPRYSFKEGLEQLKKHE